MAACVGVDLANQIAAGGEENTLENMFQRLHGILHQLNNFSTDTTTCLE